MYSNSKFIDEDKSYNILFNIFKKFKTNELINKQVNKNIKNLQLENRKPKIESHTKTLYNNSLKMVIID